MARATKGNPPDWFRGPATVVGVNVCRISGKIPTEGCGRAEVVARDGTKQIRSQIFTEYFVRGTEPFEYCPLHGGHGFWNTLATHLGFQAPGSAAASASGAPATAVAPTSGAAIVADAVPANEPAVVTQPTPKKR